MYVCTYICAVYVFAMYNLNCLYASACQAEYRLGLFWERSRTNQLIRIRCSEFHANFQSGVYITRMCNSSGEWEDADFSSCTIRIGSTPIILLEINQSLANLNTSVVTYEVSLFYTLIKPFCDNVKHSWMCIATVSINYKL